MRDLIKRIVSFGPRLPGSEADRRTTEFISSELHAYGRPADLEEIRVRPAWHLTHAIHAALAVAGTLISSTVSEPLGMLILLLVAVSTYGDLTARFYIVRFLMPRRRTAQRDVGAAAPGLRRARDPHRQPRRAAQRPAVGAPASRRAAAAPAAAGSSPRSPGRSTSSSGR